MVDSPRRNQMAVSFPWSNTQVLANSLRNGELELATAISQVNAVVRETLRIIEEVASEQIKLNIERKSKVEKMDKLIGDLSEKCQGMQQALLYKEEKYDEKCREVERYKVICELSAKAAVNDGDLFYPNRDGARTPEAASLRLSDRPADVRSTTSSELNRKTHIKLSQTQLHLSKYVNPLNCDRSSTHQIPRFDDADRGSNKVASHYLGGPCKRKQTTPQPRLVNQDAMLRERLASIGGVNIEVPRVNVGPVEPDKLYRPSDSSYMADQNNKRLKIALAGQSNKVMSSSRDAMNQIKQKFTERDLHRQVAEGCHNRLSSRRKKDWPF